MIRQAARDVLTGHETEAWDAAEFLESTGVWLCAKLFDVPEVETRRELLKLMKASRSLRERVREAEASVRN